MHFPYSASPQLIRGINVSIRMATDNPGRHSICFQSPTQLGSWDRSPSLSGRTGYFQSLQYWLRVRGFQVWGQNLDPGAELLLKDPGIPRGLRSLPPPAQLTPSQPSAPILPLNRQTKAAATSRECACAPTTPPRGPCVGFRSRPLVVRSAHGIFMLWQRGSLSIVSRT